MIVDGTLATIAGSGSIPFPPLITLHNVLHIPNLSCNLLSIGKLNFNMNYHVIFYSHDCKFQELTLKRMIGSPKVILALIIYNTCSLNFSKIKIHLYLPVRLVNLLNIITQFIQLKDINHLILSPLSIVMFGD
ncbi:hypothetical protein CR513_33034, partial [Mucuna pruriens]